MKRSLAVVLLLTLSVSVAVIAAEEKPASLPPPPGATPGVPPPPPAGVSASNPQSFPAPCILMAFRFLHPRAAVMLAEQLQLTQEQKPKVEELLAKLVESTQPKVDAQRKAADEFARALCDPATTQAATVAAAEKVMKAEVDLIAEDAKALSALRTMLTPEQTKLLTEFLDRHTVPFRFTRPGVGAGAPPPAGPPAVARPADQSK